MAKRSDKEPNEAAGEKPEQFQSPAVGPRIPNPSDAIAISLPKRGVNPAGKPPAPSPKADFDPDNVTRARANVLSPTLTLTRPAFARFTTAGTDIIGDCAIANGLGIRQPVKMKVGFSEDYRWCFLMPVHHTTPKSIEVTYNKGLANINLWGPFEGLNKTVEKGFRENYDLWMTEEPIEIHQMTGYAVYFSMETFETESVSTRDGDAVPAGPSTRATDAKSTPTSKAGAAPQGTTTSTDSATESESPTELELLAEELATSEANKALYLDMLDEKDAKIKELKAQLNALKGQTEQT